MFQPVFTNVTVHVLDESAALKCILEYLDQGSVAGQECRRRPAALLLSKLPTLVQSCTVCDLKTNQCFSGAWHPSQQDELV